MKKILIIDNYDSFTYNLVHFLEDLDCKVTVFRNDEFDIEEIKPFDKILLSPGPGIPNQAGLLKQVIQVYASTKSILGICLGQQAIAEVFGGSLINLEKVYHGVASYINVLEKNEPLFYDLPTTFEAGRYHSWVVNPIGFPDCLTQTAVDENQQIMAIRHKTFDVCGVQFHPESIMTPNGKKILFNWVNQ